jgi:phosphonate C-P lyase system protein PhnG
MTTVKEGHPRHLTARKKTIAATKAQLQEVITEVTEEMLEPLLDIMVKIGFDIAKPPVAGLLMMNIRESGGTVFHLGEVLVTQAEVKRNGQTGIGCSMGDRPDAALALACLDALCRCETSSVFENCIGKEIDRICRLVSREQNTESRMAALTQVDFHSMAEE